MNKSIWAVISILALAGVAFGAYRFFAGRAETRSFESGDTAPVSETVSAPAMEEEIAGVGESDEPEPTDFLTDSPDEPTEATVASTEADPVPAEPEPEAEEESEPDTQAVSAPRIIDQFVSFGHEDRSSRSIDTIIVHSSYDALGDDPYSVIGIIGEYRQYGVAAHYLIDRKGVIYRLVEDRDVAYHAGVSQVPDGRTGVNGFSLGIEIVEKDTDSPTDAQYASLSDLLGYLRGKYAIKYVLGHSDIAPGRKTDPWNFDWGEIR